MADKRVLITGITGQDGSYLAEFLLEKGYEVYGLVRRSSTTNFERIHHIQDHLHILSGDLLDQNSLTSALFPDQAGEVAAIGESLFTTHTLAFEVTSVLILIAILGAIYLTKKRRPDNGEGTRIPTGLEKQEVSPGHVVATDTKEAES